jgi:hypothetical protein
MSGFLLNVVIALLLLYMGAYFHGRVLNAADSVFDWTGMFFKRLKAFIVLSWQKFREPKKDKS